MSRHASGPNLSAIAREDPQLAARLFLAALPAAAARLPGTLSYRIKLEGLGTYVVFVDNGSATVRDDGDSLNQAVDFELEANPETIAALADGGGVMLPMLRGQLKLRGKRRRALQLRQLGHGNLSMRDIALQGPPPDPDVVFRALPYAIDPQWTVGHRFCVGYELEADRTGPGGKWYVSVEDGSVSVSRTPPEGGADGVVHTSHSTWLAILRGELTPSAAARQQLSTFDGQLAPVSYLGRWIERADGRDSTERDREQRQRAIQERRSTWGSGAPSGSNGRPAADAAAASPAGRKAPRRAKGGQGPGPPHGAHGTEVNLLDYPELYAQWERHNWRAHEIDFSVDKEHWLVTPTEAQVNTAFSMASFYLGEERVAADLAPFIAAAPTGEIEVFLSTQLVDEARHAVFFDRFFAEVMAVDGEDMKSRIAAAEQLMGPAWHEVFDDSLRGVAQRLKQRPDDLELFIEGISIYHMVVEGVLATTGQRFILNYSNEHGVYPGFCKGFELVERDEHRHIAFGVRFLRDACALEPRYRDIVERTVVDLVPRAARAFVPPEVDDPTDFVTYGYHSSQIYGHAYRSLKRRMALIGVEIPSASELMPGPIDGPPAVTGQVGPVGVG